MLFFARDSNTIQNTLLEQALAIVMMTKHLKGGRNNKTHMSVMLAIDNESSNFFL